MILREKAAQLYIHASGRSAGRRLRELKGFEKIQLNPGESKRMTFALGYEELKVFGLDNSYRLESCRVEIFVGGGCNINAPDKDQQVLTAVIEI